MSLLVTLIAVTHYRKNSIRTSPLFLFFGDAFLYALSLSLVLFIRYGDNFHAQLATHWPPFAILFVWWSILFYINNLFEFEFTKNWIFVIRKVVATSIIAALGSALIFYFGGNLIALSPKTNLILFSGFFTFFAIVLRLYVVTRQYISPDAIILIGESKEIQELAVFFADKYKKVIALPTFAGEKMSALLSEERPPYIVLDEKEKNAFLEFGAILQLLAQQTKVITTSAAYESIFKKIPLGEIDNVWLLEYIHIKKVPFDAIKRIVDIVGSVVLIILLSPLLLLCALLVLLFSGWPIIYSQERVGKNGKRFILYKFRTMVRNAEVGGPQWSAENDKRITPLGRLLRTSHLDELPQLFNILSGTISFVGPRPERAYFVSELTQKIPYFEIRHEIKPGLTGWAQIRHGYTSDDAGFFEKFQYDLYYIKNSSLVFDGLIILKTIRGFLPRNYTYAKVASKKSA